VFDQRDTPNGAAVFVAGRDFARRWFGGEDVIGRQMPFGPPDSKGMPTLATPVGVVDDVRYAGLDRPACGTLYFPYDQKPYSTFYLVVRTAGSPWSSSRQLRDAVHGVDLQVPLAQARTLNELRYASVAVQESRAIILGDTINTPGLNFCALVSRDGTYIFYTMNRDIYWVSAKILDELKAKAFGSSSPETKT